LGDLRAFPSGREIEIRFGGDDLYWVMSYSRWKDPRFWPIFRQALLDRHPSGLAAIQLANWAGAVPIATTRHTVKTAALKQHGAVHVISTDTTDLVTEVRRITGGKGARIIFDPVGGPEVEQLALAAAEGGIIFIYGGLSGKPTPFPHWPAALKGLSLRGWVASSIWSHPERFSRNRDLILQGLASGHLKPIIARTFPFSEIVAAHHYLESNQQVGKIVVTV
jgi:NADPH:quinone reductase-like Zn-dependent oxidoreductase